MKKSIQEHIDFIKNILQKEDTNFDWRALSDFNKTQIGFFQHERLIHLLITLFFGSIFLGLTFVELLVFGISDYLTFLNISILVVNMIVLVTLVFYIFHYFFLENSIQKLYKLEKEIMKHYHGDFMVLIE